MPRTMTPAAPTELEQIRALVGRLFPRDAWSREQLLAHQHDRLRALLEHAVSQSPYYREALGADAASLSLEELPTLSKETLIDQWDRIVCDRRVTLAGVEAHAAGLSAAEPYLDEFRVVTTSGSTGLRAVFVYGSEDWHMWVASCLRRLAVVGVGPKTRLATIGAPDPVHMSKQLFSVFTAADSTAPELSALTPMGEMVDALNAYRPEALMGYASVLALLAGEQLHGQLDITPRFVWCVSETLTEDLRAGIEAAWGHDPANVYAATESPTIAVSSPEHPRALEIFEDMIIVEVVDERGDPVPPGVPGAKVLLTNLANSVQPLIRYELSDRVTRAAGPNPAGRPYACLASIDGRAIDTLYLPGASGGFVVILPYRFGAPFSHLSDVRQFQIAWDGSRMLVRVLLRDGAPGGALEHVRVTLAEALREAGAAPVDVDVEPVSSFPREPGPAAKFKLIESTAPPIA
jgi:phenylacetate-coenzyme A ligase PaaK-like adenylate-forming protein